jgi:tRNA(His) 5'-end guanylyltransferase
MSSKSFGSNYQVMERLGKYRLSTLLFVKAGVNYQCACFSDSAGVIEDSVVVEKDYEKITKVEFTKKRKISKESATG